MPQNLVDNSQNMIWIKFNDRIVCNNILSDGSDGQSYLTVNALGFFLLLFPYIKTSHLCWKYRRSAILKDVRTFNLQCHERVFW